MLRYRSMVALAFVLLALEHLATMLIFRAYPVERIGSPARPTVNLWLFVAMVAGVGLSLVPRGAAGESRRS